MWKKICCATAFLGMTLAVCCESLLVSPHLRLSSASLQHHQATILASTRLRISSSSSTIPPEQDTPIAIMNEKKHPYQSNNNVGWRNMLIYWTIGGIVGHDMGYDHAFSSANGLAEAVVAGASSPEVISGFMGCMGLTIVGRFLLNNRYMGFDRRLDWPAIFTFAISNCIYETFLFLASYDFGKSLVVNYADHPLASPASGMLVFFMYSALIHAFFWLPHVFPKHVRPNSPSFLTHGLPALTLFSVAWMTFFEVVGQDQESAPAVILAICVCHFVVDLWAGYTMRLERPKGFW